MIIGEDGSVEAKVAMARRPPVLLEGVQGRRGQPSDPLPRHPKSAIGLLGEEEARELRATLTLLPQEAYRESRPIRIHPDSLDGWTESVPGPEAVLLVRSPSGLATIYSCFPKGARDKEDPPYPGFRDRLASLRYLFSSIWRRLEPR